MILDTFQVLNFLIQFLYTLLCAYYRKSSLLPPPFPLFVLPRPLWAMYFYASEILRKSEAPENDTQSPAGYE